MIFPGRFVDIANELNVSSATCSFQNLEKLLPDWFSAQPIEAQRRKSQSFIYGDLELIEVLKRQKPSITHAEVMDCLYDCGDLPFGTFPCEMNSQLSGNSQEFLRIPRNSQKFSTMQISLHQISLEFLRIFGNGKLGLTLGLEFLGILSFTILEA